jgi:hypothetical protein
MTNYQEIVGALVIHVASLALAPNDLDLALGTINQRKTTNSACTGAGRCARHHNRADERHSRGLENGRWGREGGAIAAVVAVATCNSTRRHRRRSGGREKVGNGNDSIQSVARASNAEGRGIMDHMDLGYVYVCLQVGHGSRQV